MCVDQKIILIVLFHTELENNYIYTNFYSNTEKTIIYLIEST